MRLPFCFCYIHSLSADKKRKDTFFILLCLFISRHFIKFKKSWKADSRTGCGECVIINCENGCRSTLLCFSHLCCKRSLPDDCVKLKRISGKTCFCRFSEMVSCRADCLVSFLCHLRRGFVISWFCRKEITAIKFLNLNARCINAFGRQCRRVSTHISNEALFIKLLCKRHYFLNTLTHLSCRILLQC